MAILLSEKKEAGKKRDYIAAMRTDIVYEMKESTRIVKCQTNFIANTIKHQQRTLIVSIRFVHVTKYDDFYFGMMKLMHIIVKYLVIF